MHVLYDVGRPCVWGRGAIDDKHLCLGWLEALEDLLRRNYVPKRSFFLALGHDEEVCAALACTPLQRVGHTDYASCTYTGGRLSRRPGDRPLVRTV